MRLIRLPIRLVELVALSAAAAFLKWYAPGVDGMVRTEDDDQWR